jgi:hypothetical protein
VIGTAARHALSEQDLELVRTYAGRTLGLGQKPLAELQYLRGVHADRQAAAARAYGPDSWTALFEQAAVDILDTMIAQAQSPEGRAADRVRKLTEELRKTGSVATEQKLTEAMSELLTIERQRQLTGAAGDSSEAMALVVDALNAAGERRNGVLKELVDKGKRDPSSVSDEQLRTAVTDALSVDRQKQMMGVADGEGGSAMPLVVDALNVSATRRNDHLNKLLDKAKRNPGSVSDEEIRKARVEALSTDRQRQLLGVPDPE